MAIDKNIEIKKKEASDWFRSLRDDFCKTFEDLDSKNFRESFGITKEKAEAK